LSVVDDGEAEAVRDLLDTGDDVLVGVEDDVVGTGFAGKCGLFFGGNGGDDVDAEALRHLDEEQTGAAGASVDEDLVAALGHEGCVQQVVCGHALQDGGGGLLGGDPVRDFDEARGGCGGELGVGAGNAAPGDTVAGAEAGDVRRYGDDGSGGFLPERVGQLGGIAAFSEVGVDEVDAGGLDGDDAVAGGGRGLEEVREGEDFGTTVLEDLNGSHRSGC
jgi:hypothetical protein